MRLAFILVPLMLSTSAALAEPPPQQTSAGAPERDAHHHRLAPTHQLTPTSYPAYHRDARKKSAIAMIYSVDVSLKDEPEALARLAGDHRIRSAGPTTRARSRPSP